MGALSSSMTIAGAGLLPNPPADVGAAFTDNDDLGGAIAGFEALPTINNFADVVSSGNAFVGIPGNASISSATFNSLITIGASNFPSINNIPPQGTSINNLVAYNLSGNNIFFVTDAISFNSTQMLGNGDLSKFCQAFMSATGYISQANQTINSVNNADILAQTFNPNTGGMDTLSTGGLNQVSNDLTLFSSDLSRLGRCIDLANLEDLGLPGQLLAQIGQVGNGDIPAVSEMLRAVTIPEAQIKNLAKGTNTLTSAEEKLAYKALMAVTGKPLEQILLILRVRTANIKNAAQLLDPRILFPQSYLTLLCPTANKLEKVYLGDQAVNYNLKPILENVAIADYAGPNNTNSLNTLSIIIPPDQALANKALARSLGQVKNIATSTLPSLSAAAATVTTSSDLPAVSSLTTPVPESVKTFYLAALGPGTGPNGTIVLADILGQVSGIYITSNLKIATSAISNIMSGSLTANIAGNLVLSYESMLELFGGTYGDGPVVIPSGPAAGSYTDWNDALTNGLIPYAVTQISLITSTDSGNVTKANNAYTNIISNMGGQRSASIEAGIDYANLTANNKSATMNFTTNLHSYGQDVAPDGANEFLTAIANPDTLSGQCVISSLREGLNIKNLQDAGIYLDTQLDDK